MSEEKIKIKAGRLLFFLVGHNFYMSEDSLTVKYSESGLAFVNTSGLSISHVRRPGLSNFSPGLASIAFNKSNRLAKPYLRFY